MKRPVVAGFLDVVGALCLIGSAITLFTTVTFGGTGYARNRHAFLLFASALFNFGFAYAVTVLKQIAAGIEKLHTDNAERNKSTPFIVDNLPQK